MFLFAFEETKMKIVKKIRNQH